MVMMTRRSTASGPESPSLPSGALEKVDEQFRLVAARLPLVPEQLLELVDEDANVLVLDAFE
jgi:hypothetical protein